MSEKHQPQDRRSTPEPEGAGCCGGHKRDSEEQAAPAKDARKGSAAKQGCCG